MIKFYFILLFVFSLGSLKAQESASEVKEGHSHNGHAFNEGPRQAGELIGKTGDVHLPISSAWEKGQDYFNQGLGQLHGFWYYEAERSFRKILAHDPNCLMAYWGLSQANIENDKRAKEFIDKAAKLQKDKKLKITPHEQAYFDAEVRYHDNKKQKDSLKRRQNFLRDYEDIILKYPDDIEAKALLVCRRWQFSRKGIPITSYTGLDAILEQIFKKSPKHPAHHYAIHLWDYRKHEQALDSAALLRKTAPSIAHMWHMPGHILSKAKRYQDATWHQEASARIDHAHMQKWLLLPDQIHNYAHNNQWLAKNFSYLGNVRGSIDMAKSLIANPRHPKLNISYKAGSARYGRTTLINTLEKAELWEEALMTTQSDWLEPLEKPEDDLSRLRLIGVCHYHLENKSHLADSIADLKKLSQSFKGTLYDSIEKAREQATKEKKNKEEILTAEKKAKDNHKNKVKQFEKSIAELEGYLAAMNGNLEAAKKSLKKNTPNQSRMAYHLKFGQPEEAAKLARQQISKKDKQALPLAQAIHVLHAIKADDPDIKKGFEELRSISSDIELGSPVFVRLNPIAKKLGFPDDWRIAYKPSDNLTLEDDLESLGPLHWTPPAAPHFELPDQNNQLISLQSYEGKPFILVFYLGAGCLHCTEQLTTMADRYSDFKKAGLPILAISTDNVKDLKKSQANYSKGDIPFPIVSNFAKDVFKKYTAHDDFENEPLHGTFVIDAKSRILWSDISADPFMEIDFLIKEAQRLVELHQ